MRLLAWIFGIALVVFLGTYFLFGHHGKKATPGINQPVILPLPDYASTGASVSMTIDGRVNGDDAHRSIKIIVSRDYREIDIIQGYQGNVIDKHTFANNQNAFGVFLKSINYSGFMLKRKGTSASADPQGVCPTENRYIFTLTDEGNNDLSNLYTTDCGTNSGNSGGDIETLTNLFENQITGYNDITANVQLD